MENNSIYVWGRGEKGQLGLALKKSRDKPTELVLEKKHTGGGKVTHLTCGAGYTMALLDNGRLLSWGFNSYGQLGRGDHSVSGGVEAVTGIEGVVRVCCGANHTMAMTKEGEVYVWGQNDYGAAAVDESKYPYLTQPKQVSLRTSVIGIMCGTQKSLVITRDGKIFGWGQDFGHIPKDLGPDSTKFKIPYLRNLYALFPQFLVLCPFIRQE